jgi:hypothetical protein
MPCFNCSQPTTAAEAAAANSSQQQQQAVPSRNDTLVSFSMLKCSCTAAAAAAAEVFEVLEVASTVAQPYSRASTPCFPVHIASTSQWTSREADAYVAAW